MHRNKSNLIAAALVAAIGLGVPALAKSTHGGKGKTAAGQSTRVVQAQRERALNVRTFNARGLNAYGTVPRSPTFGAPNPNSPALTGGGSIGYNANLYVY